MKNASITTPVPRPEAYQVRSSIFTMGFAALTLLFLLSLGARAQDFWIGGFSTNPTWNQGGNWNLGFAPFPTNDAVFQTPVPSVPGSVITLSNVEVANSLTFEKSYTLTGGTLQLSAGNSVFSGLIAVAPGAVATINTALVGSNPIIVGTDGLVGAGGGTLILNAANNSMGALTIQKGSVYVNGIQHIAGNYTQSAGTLLGIGVGAGQSGELLSAGVANLAGALQIVPLNGFKLQRGKKVTLIAASQGINGRFGTVIDGFNSTTILEPTVIYTRNSVILEAVQGSFASLAAGLSLTPNERAVGGMLDSASHDSHANSLFAFLDDRALSKLPGDFNKISPDALTSVFALGTAVNEMQSHNVQRRNDDLRSGASGFNASNLAINGNGPSFSGGLDITTGVAGPNGPFDDGKEVKEMKQVAPAENRWGAFLSGTGEWVSVGDTNNARGYDLASGGFTLGVDYKVCPNFAIGLMGGYTGTTANLADGGRVYVNGGKVGVYATAFAGGWYADVAAIGGYDSYDTRRSALQGTARGDTDGNDLDVLVGTGYDFKAGGLTFGPTGSFDYSYTGINAYNESGSLAPLSIHSGNGESLRTAFGLKASYDCKCGGIVIKPEVRASWQHEYGDATYGVDSSLASGAGNTFTVHGPTIGRDSCLLGAGFAIQCSERFSTYFYYDGELGRKNYESNAVTGGVRLSF